VITVGGLPYKCPLAPLEMTFMLESYFRKIGKRKYTYPLQLKASPFRGRESFKLYYSFQEEGYLPGSIKILRDSAINPFSISRISLAE